MTGINYGPQYGFTYDANGRLGGMQDVESGHGNATVATASYGVAGEMLGLSYFGYSETRTYNALLQMTHVTVPGMMDMQYLYTAGANNGRIAQSVDGVTGETLTYGYDTLNRLSGVSGAWSQTYSYDGFGNLTGKSAVGAYPAMNASFDPLTNRQNGLSYDANGNVTANGAGYDVENRLAGDSTALYVYDHAGKRVEKRYQATEEYYFYGIGGQKLVTQVCQTTESGWGCGDRQYNVYFGGKLVKSKGVVVVTDRLGSVRANSNGERMSYYPYGEEKTTTADGREKFGTYTRDNASTDYADQRYYAVGMGRFNSADPYRNSAGARDPGSWNRYAYVGGDPLNFIDPHGTRRVCIGPADDRTCWDEPDPSPSGPGADHRHDLPEPEPGPEEPVDPEPAASPLEIAGEKLSRVRDPLKRAANAQSIFSAEQLDCISGIETGREWDPKVVANNGRVGLFQFNQLSWAYSGTAIAWKNGESAKDPYTAAVVALALLTRNLGYGGVQNPTTATVTEAIDKFGEHDGQYGRAVVDCADKLKNGDFSGAIGALENYANWVQGGRR